MFVERGWSATTIAAVAEAARVSPDLVSSAFGGKAGLFMAALRRAGFGDHVDLPAAFGAMGLDDEPSREARMDRIIELACHALGSMAPLFSVLPLAADQDPELQRLVVKSEQNLHDIAGDVVRLLADGDVHPDAVDEVYLLLRSQTYLALVRWRSWSVERYAAWLRRRLWTVVTPQG